MTRRRFDSDEDESPIMRDRRLDVRLEVAVYGMCRAFGLETLNSQVRNGEWKRRYVAELQRREVAISRDIVQHFSDAELDYVIASLLAIRLAGTEWQRAAGLLGVELNFGPWDWFMFTLSAFDLCGLVMIAVALILQPFFGAWHLPRYWKKEDWIALRVTKNKEAAISAIKKLKLQLDPKDFDKIDQLQLKGKWAKRIQRIEGFPV